MSVKWSMLKKMCGTIWIGMGEHFFNNTVVNLLHITTVNGTDNMQIIRVMLANFISFSVVAIVYYVRKRNHKYTNSNLLMIYRAYIYILLISKKLNINLEYRTIHENGFAIFFCTQF